MQKALLLASCCTAASALFAQVKKQFSVEGSGNCQNVQLSIKAKTGNCFLKPSQNEEILNIYSNQEVEDYSHSLKKETKGGLCLVNLSLQQEGEKGVGQNISYKVFGGETHPSEKFWKIYLSDKKPYELDLSYGLGNANIDLSGLAIGKLKINTGSADVSVVYNSGVPNKVNMDTFFVKVDLGSLSVKNMTLSRSRVVMADVGFGNIMLDFSEKPIINQRVIGSVGAGNLVVLLPSQEVPVLVKITDSWLCSLSLAKSLKKISSNTYANSAYSKDPKNPLYFDLDVSMGKIVFKEKSP